MNVTKPSPQPVQLIRVGLFAGPLFLAAVAFVIHGQASWKPTTLPPAFGYVLVAYAVIAVLVARAMRGRIMASGDAGRRAALLIMGWAAGESAALFGAVIFFLTGHVQWFLLGVFAMICAFALLPARAAM